MALAWGSLQEVFVMLVVVVFFFTSLEVFHSRCFSTSSVTLSWAIAGFISPAHRRVIHDTFILTFLGFSVTFLPQVLCFWAGLFLSMVVFYPTLRSGHEHPIQDVPLCLLSQSCPFRLTHGLELLMFELLDHWFIDCASEPQSIVKIKLLNIFCLLKVIWKDYKNTLSRTW